ncbi:DUF551 domain-containing protein [Yersinia enterocolitica]|uniref:DUF551 domain-containing protein n=1 Tax=Yersinia enterocolitica TaxID=630 RepID=UPI003CFFF30E
MKELDSFTVERLEELSTKENIPEVAALAQIALAAKRAEPVAYMTYKGYLIHAADPKLSEYSEPQPLYDAPRLNSKVPLGSWIKCSDQMPENSTDVTLFHPEIGVFNGYCWRGLIKDKEPVFFSNSGEHDDGPKQGVTHWMPLPKAPENPL